MAVASRTVPAWRSLDDAAIQSGVSRRTLNRWIADGKLRVYTRAGDRRRYVDLDDIRKLQQLGPIDRPLGSSPYTGDMRVIPPNEPKWQPVYNIMYLLGVATHSLRPYPEPNNYFSLQFPLEVWALGHADARARLLEATRDAVESALLGHELDPADVLVEIVPDTVHGPSLP